MHLCPTMKFRYRALPGLVQFWRFLCHAMSAYSRRCVTERERGVGFRSDIGLTLETSAFESLYGGQFTLSTQLIKPNYFNWTGAFGRVGLIAGFGLYDEFVWIVLIGSNLKFKLTEYGTLEIISTVETDKGEYEWSTPTQHRKPSTDDTENNKKGKKSKGDEIRKRFFL